VVFSADGRLLAAWGPAFSKVDVLDAADGMRRVELNEAVRRFRAAAFSPDGSLIALVGFTKDDERGSVTHVFVRDTATGEPVASFELPDELLYEIAFSPDGRLIGAGDDHGRVRLWDARTGELQVEAEGYDMPVIGLSWSPDGQRIATTADPTGRAPDSTGQDAFALRDAKSLAVMREFSGHYANVAALAFSPDGRRIASACRDHLVRLWDAESGARLLPTPGHEIGVGAVAASADGARVLTGGDDGKLGSWSGLAWTLQSMTPAHSAPVLAVACSPDGRLAASSALDGSVVLWPSDPAAQSCGWIGDSAHASRALAFAPDGRTLASAEADGKVRLRDVSPALTAAAALDADAVQAMSLPTRELDASGNVAFSVAWSPDGQWIATGTSRLRIFGAATGELAHDIKGTSPIASIAWSPDGALIATANADRTVRVYEAATGTARGTASGHPGRVQAVTFSRDGSLLASAGDNETVIRLWHVATLAPAGQLAGHADTVRALTAVGEGLLLSTSSDGTALVWDASAAARSAEQATEPAEPRADPPR
jgi:WD40 repeat protein